MKYRDFVEKLVSVSRGVNTLQRSAVRLCDGHEILRKYTEGKGYKNIVEIGTFRGVTAAWLSYFCKKVYTIDLKRAQIDMVSHFSVEPRYNSIWYPMGINNIELVLIDNNEDKKKFLDKLDFDFAFIDGAHDKTVASDFEYTRKCGHVLFHDYEYRDVPGQHDVFDFINTLPKEHITIDRCFALWQA